MNPHNSCPKCGASVSESKKYVSPSTFLLLAGTQVTNDGSQVQRLRRGMSCAVLRGNCVMPRT